MKDDATVEDVYKAIESGTSIDHFTIRYGPPSAMKTIQKDQLNALAVSLGLHGQTLTIVPLETESTFVPGLVPKPSFADGEVHVPGNITSDSDPGDVLVSWPEREGVLRRSKAGVVVLVHADVIQYFASCRAIIAASLRLSADHCLNKSQPQNSEG